MTRKRSTPGRIDKAQGIGSLKITADNTVVLSSGSRNKKLSPTSSRYSRSKRENVSRTSIDFTIGRLSAGQAVTELDVYEHSFSRYRRADSLIVLREVHRRYPKNTTLEIINGLHTLVPVPARTAP